MMETLQLDDLTFEVRRSARRQRLGLTVDRGGELIIHAPQGLSSVDMSNWVGKKLLWVHRKLAVKEELIRPVRGPEYVSGESFSYLGRNYRLKVVADQKEPLRFDGKRFFLQAAKRSEAAEHFRTWYIRVGRQWLRERVGSLARKTGTVPSRVEVRDLGFRWGSCGRNGVLFFNWRLLQLPVRLVDYVIAHELIHLKEPHHGSGFWRSLEEAIPDWEERKDSLRSQAGCPVAFRVPAGR